MPKLRALLFPCLIACSAGAVFGVYASHALLFALFFSGSALVLLARVLRGYYPLTTLCVFALLFFALGIFRGAAKAEQLACTELCARVNTHVQLSGVVVKEPETRGDKQRFAFAVDESATPGTVLVTLPRYPEFEYGSHLRIKGMLRAPEDFLTEAGAQFHYVDFLRARGSTLLLSGSHAEVIGENRGHPIVRNLLLFKQKIRAVTLQLPTREGGLLMGMIFGGKSGLPDDVQRDFLIAGLIHIVVLSGQNLTIIALLATAFVRKFFGFIMGLIVSGIIVIAYAMIGGMEPATLRALVLVLIVFLATLLRRESSLPRVISCGALFLILHNPFLVRDDPSFQLSLLAILGLVFIGPITERFLLLRGLSLPLVRYVAPILGAQLGVLPFIVWMSQTISPYALLANILVLSTIEFLSISGIIFVFTGMLIPAFVPFIMFPVQLALSFVLHVAHVIARLPGASIQVSVSGWFVFLIYGAISLWLIIRWRSREMTPLAQFTLREEVKQLAKRKIPWAPPVPDAQGIQFDRAIFAFVAEKRGGGAVNEETIIWDD